jgi:hypothetical protein
MLKLPDERITLMRIRSLVITALGLAVLTACTATPEKVGGEAGPAGSPFRTPGVTASASATVSAGPSASDRATVPVKSSRPAGSSASSKIRRTDWDNVTLAGLDHMGFADARFRNGTATSGANSCTMLPGNARPAYAEYLTEEPADSPVTEDALILIECGSDGKDQVLVPVKLAFDQKTRVAMGLIRADLPTGPDNRMTFTSYSVQRSVIVAGVRRTDGSRETRRYRFDGGRNWERI